MHSTVGQKFMRQLFYRCWPGSNQFTIKSKLHTFSVCQYHSHVFKFARNYSSQNIVLMDNCKLIKSEDVKSNMESKKLSVLEEFKLQQNKAIANNYIDIKLYLLRNLDIKAKNLADLAKDCLEVYQLNVEDIESWIQFLFKNSFDREQIKSLIQNYPWLLLVPVQKIAKTFYDVIRTIEIARLELPIICVNAPCVLAEDFDILSEKHDYFHFIMSYRNVPEIIKSGVFSFSLNHIKLRHQFLYRRGQYFQTSRHGTSRKPNHSVSDMFCSSDKKFCEDVANCDLKEYELFRAVFSAEQKLEHQAIDEDSDYVIVSGKQKPADRLNDESDLKENTFADELIMHL